MLFRSKKYADQREACFACTTPYQLLGAISIVQNNGINADLYLFGLFNRMGDFIERLKKYSIFKEIILVDNQRFKPKGIFKAVFQALNSRKEAGRFLPPERVYDTFYTTSRAYGKMILIYELQRRKKDIKYVFYEDGMGSYLKTSSQLNSSWQRFFIELIKRCKPFSPAKTSIMVSFPHLLELPDKLKNISISRMLPMMMNDSNKMMLMDVFSMNNDDVINAKVILFDTVRGGVAEKTMDIDAMDKGFEDVVEAFSGDVICKPHPKSLCFSAINVPMYTKQYIPTELIYTTMEDLERRILVGNLSTAMFTPKLLFNKEPIVISLHKMVWPQRKDLIAVFDKFASSYENRERVFAPNNREEMRNYLKSCRNRNT